VRHQHRHRGASLCGQRVKAVWLNLDEPLNNLDANLREEMHFGIKDLQRRFGFAILYVTHDQSEAMTLSDRVAVFNQGRIEQLATPQALYDAPANPFVANFLGDNNMLNCTLVHCAPGGTAGGVRTASGQLLQARICATTALENEATVKLCVRPEFLQVATECAALATPNCLSGSLVDLIHQGDHWRVVVRLASLESGPHSAPLQWFAKVSPGALPPGLVVGQNVSLGFRPEDAWVF